MASVNRSCHIMTLILKKKTFRLTNDEKNRLYHSENINDDLEKEFWRVYGNLNF